MKKRELHYNALSSFKVFKCFSIYLLIYKINVLPLTVGTFGIVGLSVKSV